MPVTGAVALGDQPLHGTSRFLAHWSNDNRLTLALEFDPFWEFVSGPLHAGTFGPGTLDNTFGPEVRFNSRKPGEAPSGPWTADQFFGTVEIRAKTRAATVTHFNRDGVRLWSVELPPADA